MIYDYDYFTMQANTIIAGFSDSIINAIEKCDYGDYDDMGPTEYFWSLYIIIKNADDSIEKLKYYREVYYMQDDEDSEIEYEHTLINKNDEDIFNSMIENPNHPDNDDNYHDYNYNSDDYDDYDDYNDYDEDENTIKNTPIESLTIQGQKVCNSLSGTILYVYEKYNYGDCDEYGPTEHMWSLFVAVKNNEEISFHKYYREVYELQGDKDKLIDYYKEPFEKYDNEIIDKIISQISI